MSAAQSDAVPPGEGRVRAAVQGLCGSGLQRGPLPVPQPVPGHRHQGDVHTGGAVYKYSNFQVCVCWVCGWVGGSGVCACVCVCACVSVRLEHITIYSNMDVFVARNGKTIY